MTSNPIISDPHLSQTRSMVSSPDSKPAGSEIAKYIAQSLPPLTSLTLSHRHTISPIVKVTVGKDGDEAVHHLHSSLLCTKSEYFRGCLRSGFAEAVTREVSLPDEDPTAFGYFVEWMYANDINPLRDLSVPDISGTLIDIYALADRILCVGLKNRAVDLIQARDSGKRILVSNVMKIIRLSIDDCKLLQYSVKQLAWEMCYKETSYAEYISAEGWHDMIVADSKATTMLIQEVKYWQGKCRDLFFEEEPATPSGCQWHVHPTDESKAECVR